MVHKIHVLMILTLVSITTQKRVGRRSFNPTPEELRNVVEHLKTHASKVVAPLQAQVDDDNLKLHVKPDGTVQMARDLPDVDDRICKVTGRCGCSGGRCGRQGDQELDVNALQQIAYELGEDSNKDALRICKRKRKCGRQCCKRGKVQKPYDSDDDSDYEYLRGRCKYGRCGRGCCSREGSFRTGSRYEGPKESDPLRCRYGRCGRGCCGRSDGKPVTSQLDQFGKRFRVTKDMDAVVVDLSKDDGVLGALAERLFKKVQSDDLNVDKDAGLDYIFGLNKETDFGDDENEKETLVVDLTQKNNDQDLITQLVNDIIAKANNNEDDDPVRPNEIVDYFLEKKQHIVGNALNFVKNSKGKKDISNLSTEQKRALQQLRAQVQRLGAKSSDKEVEDAVMEVVLGEGSKSEVLPHNENTNNVYVPNWVHKAFKAEREDLRTKRLFPLTARQKLKMFTKNRSFWRRNAEENVNNYGVPFQLQIKGLGQVNP